MRKISWTLLWGVVTAAAMISCGGSNPAGPSAPSGGLSLQGVVLPGATSASAQPGRVAAMAAGGGHITVTLQANPSISTTISSNGTFQLSGLPPTGFTLVFTANGVNLGTITVTPAQGTTTVHLVVEVTTNSVTLVSENDDDNENQPSPSPSPKPSASPTACIIDDGRTGQKVEVEGTVASGTSASFMLKVGADDDRSPGTVTVTTSGTTKFKCGGDDDNSAPSTTCTATLKTGSKVHVKGTLMSCTSTTAAVTATEVQIQKADGDNQGDND